MPQCRASGTIRCSTRAGAGCLTARARPNYTPRCWTATPGAAGQAGAGGLPADLTPEGEAAYERGLRAALEAGGKVLREGGDSMDAVIAAVTVLEDDPLFNAGRGAVLNCMGEAELDASVMDGASGRGGAVAAVRHVRNPARLEVGRAPVWTPVNNAP